MTCIVGLIDKKTKTTYIGGDSLGSCDSFKVVRKDKKVFKLKNSNNVCLGFTSSFRMGDILRYNTNLTKPEDVINHENLVVNFVPKLIEEFSKFGYQKTSSNVISGGTFLIAQKDKLFKIDCDYQVAESDDLYDATGSGQTAALASLFTTSKMDITPIERIRLALQAATKWIPSVAPPFYIINTNDDKVVKFLN